MVVPKVLPSYWKLSLIILLNLIRVQWAVPTPPTNLELFDPTYRGAVQLPSGDDVSSTEIQLMVPIKYFGTTYHTIFVNSNGLLSFQMELSNFINTELPLMDYSIIAPFYSNVDTGNGIGTISYYETNDPQPLSRVTNLIHTAYAAERQFQPTGLFVATWSGVGYFKRQNDRINTYQTVLASDGFKSFALFLYPANGIQWIQSTGDESGLPDARAQAGFNSADGRVHILPGSGTEQVHNLDSWSNINMNGYFLYRIDGEEILPPDDLPTAKTSDCSQSPTTCHGQAKCIDYETAFCCNCNEQYYGDGVSCVKKDVPLRVNGKVDGTINNIEFTQLDLQSYIVMSDGRAYTAISRIPSEIGYSIQILQILGATIGYVFAKPIRHDVFNGYQLTGGKFQHTATLTFVDGNEQIRIEQKFLGLDVYDQLRLETHLEGTIPQLSSGTEEIKFEIDEYEEEYIMTADGLIESNAARPFYYYVDNKSERQMKNVKIEQKFTFTNWCPARNYTQSVLKLKVGRNFVSYEAREQIIRFGMSNKIAPLGDMDPCAEEGHERCGTNSVCVVENDSYRCLCSAGYHQIFDGTETRCVDINECQMGLHNCDTNAQCRNVPDGKFSCVCLTGFEGDGYNCQPSMSCAKVECASNAHCQETNTGVICNCVDGYYGDGRYNCAPIEGDRITQRCSDGICWCPEDYVIESGTNFCTTNGNSTRNTVPTDEDCDVSNGCHPDALCVFGGGRYRCQCNDGYRGDGYVCDQIPEFSEATCSNGDDCDIHASCTFDPARSNSYCVCNIGYDGNGVMCTYTSICSSNADCTLTEDCLYTSAERYECVCKDSFQRDSQNQCVKSETCGGGVCVENAECLFDDEYQVHYCSCRTGYIGDGITECRQRPIGCNVINNCGLHATCHYDDSSTLFQCKCDSGFYGDGFVCYTEINCHVDPTLCDPQTANCVTDADRRYVCQCRNGYVGNGSICRPAPRHEGGFLLLNQGIATLRIPIEGGTSKTGRPIQMRNFQIAVGMDIDCLEGRFYWSDINGMTIRSATYNGTSKTDFIVTEIGSAEGLAIDWVSRNIYWTDSSRDTIEVAGLETGRRRRRILFADGLVNPRGIAVHPQRGKIFWSDWNRAGPKIEWANADGTGREIFLSASDGIGLPNSLTIDYETEQLCYADAGGPKSIECVDIDSRTRTVMAANCTYPFGIAILGRHIYWSDWISKQIEGVDKFTLHRLPPLNVPLGGSGNKLFALVAVPDSCPALTNVCQYYKDQCPPQHICVPNGAGSRKCICTQNIDDITETLICTL